MYAATNVLFKRIFIFILLLKQKFIFNFQAPPEFTLVVDRSIKDNNEKCLLEKNVEFYNTKLAELSKFFASQSCRYMQIKNILQECINIIDIFNDWEVLPNNIISNVEVKNYKDKLCSYRKKFIDEQLEVINDRQTIIRVQKQFQKILADYASIIYEFEILKDENLKLTTMQDKLTEEHTQKLLEMENHISKEKEIFYNEKRDLLTEQLKLEMIKKLVDEEKKKNLTEYSVLLLEKEKLSEEKKNLLHEKSSLDFQSKMYEAEEGTLQKEKKILEKKCEDLSNEIHTLNEDFFNMNKVMNKLYDNVSFTCFSLITKK
jgi:hypothetical protein